MSESCLKLVIKSLFWLLALLPLWVFITPKSCYKFMHKVMKKDMDNVKNWAAKSNIKTWELKDTPQTMLFLRITALFFFIVFSGMAIFVSRLP